MDESIKMILALVLITAVAVSIISVSYSLTKPLIDSAREKSFQQTVERIFPGSDSNRKVGEKYEVYSNGILVGYAALASAKGYSSQIQLVVGIDLDNRIAGVAVISQQETPGLGTKVADESFLSQFHGMSADGILLRKFGGKIDAVTGATVSSKAVAVGVKEKVSELVRKN
jgi:electron transport complex protein RnfG